MLYVACKSVYDIDVNILPRSIGKKAICKGLILFMCEPLSYPRTPYSRLNKYRILVNYSHYHFIYWWAVLPKVVLSEYINIFTRIKIPYRENMVQN